MLLWEVFVIVGLVALILEMVAPLLFFLNLAVAGFITAIVAFFIPKAVWLTIIFVVLSLVAIFCLRPVLIKNRETKEHETGMDAKYVGKIVKVIEPVNKFSGAITVYDERWEARTDSDEVIPVGAEVKIIKYDSLVLTVEKI